MPYGRNDTGNGERTMKQTYEAFYTLSRELDAEEMHTKPALLNSQAPMKALAFWNNEKRIVSQFIAADLDAPDVAETIQGWKDFPIQAVWQTNDCTGDVDIRKLIVAVRWPTFQAAERDVSVLVHFEFQAKGSSAGPRIYPLPIEKSELAIKTVTE